MENLLGKNYHISERKSSKFGQVGVWDRGNELSVGYVGGKPLHYYDNLKRTELYESCLDRYNHDQLARPIIDIIVHAIFSENPDFQGDDKLVARANEVVRDSLIDWSNWGADLEVHGDFFLRSFFGKKAKIASIPASSIDIDYSQNNILDIKRYIQFKDTTYEKSISPDEMAHLKIHNTSNMVFGSSTLRPALWWFDVLDNLWERNWIRAAQYYGAPIVSVVGVPGEYQAAVKASLEGDGQRPGRNWVFPEGVSVDTLDFTKNYPIELLIDRVYQYILACCGVPQHLVYESNSSRGVAMFSADGFNMMIKNRQRTWELGLISALKAIFEDEGIWKDNSKFRIRWAPVFLRDLKNLASLMDMAMANKLLSKQTAREMISVDHSEEEERIDAEPDEPDEIPVVQNPMAPQPQTPPGKPASIKRGRGSNKRL